MCTVFQKNRHKKSPQKWACHQQNYSAERLLKALGEGTTVRESVA